MEDLISRQAAMAYPLSWEHYDKEHGDMKFICGVESYREYIEHLPSAEPGEWIPCSERLPRYDETSEYLITDKARRVRHCCLDLYMPETFVTVEEGMIVDAVAWRPAPDPWKEERTNESNDRV